MGKLMFALHLKDLADSNQTLKDLLEQIPLKCKPFNG
jgi:hypothetical protein